MKKIIYILLLILFIPLLSSGCSSNNPKTITQKQIISENHLNNNVIASEIDISKIENIDFIRDINDPTKINGVYGYNGHIYDLSSNKEKKFLILFNGIDGVYSDVSFSVKDNKLIINYKYNVVKGKNQKTLFMIDDKSKIKSYDTIQIIKNEKQDSFVIMSG